MEALRKLPEYVSEEKLEEWTHFFTKLQDNSDIPPVSWELDVLQQHSQVNEPQVQCSRDGKGDDTIDGILSDSTIGQHIRKEKQRPEVRWQY